MFSFEIIKRYLVEDPRGIALDYFLVPSQNPLISSLAQTSLEVTYLKNLFPINHQTPDNSAIGLPINSIWKIFKTSCNWLIANLLFRHSRECSHIFSTVKAV